MGCSDGVQGSGCIDQGAGIGVQNWPFLNRPNNTGQSAGASRAEVLEHAVYCAQQPQVQADLTTVGFQCGASVRM